MDDVAISVQRLSVRFAGRGRAPAVHAVRDLDLEACRGEITGLLGPNGSGKTTLLRVLCADQRITSGAVRVLGRTPGDRANARAVGVQHDAKLPFPHASARELLEYFGALLDLKRVYARARAELLIERLDLEHARDRAIRTFSTGMTRRLAFAAAMLAEPELLLLDEPTAGLDPNGSLLVGGMLREFADAGGAVLMASHHLQEVEETCDRVHLLRHGEIALSGTLDEVLGTDEETLTTRGLDSNGHAAVEAAVEAAGGEAIRWARARRHMFSLFREPGPS